jgi:glycosyltransferase involved in cell wall biosynthesis
MSLRTLFVFTGSYPYSAAAENTFLPQELAVLATRFEKVVVVPGTTDGSSEPIGLPNVTVDNSFACFRRSRARRWAALAARLADPAFLRESVARRTLFARHPGALKKALVYKVQAAMTTAWIRQRTGGMPDIDRIALYTWWFDAPTLGLAQFGSETGAVVLTRAHGYDLYENRHSPAYIPFRHSSLRQLDAVYADSQAGAKYLAQQYPDCAHKVRCALLGVSDPGFTSRASTDGVWRIVSCSFLTPVKRIDLLIQALEQLGFDRPDVQVEWTHIGDGPERERLAELARRSLLGNIRFVFPGYPGKREVYDYYRDHPVDLFVNVSESEGTPVSIMEAMSLGIPILCTAVGGNIDAVGQQNGLLLAANPLPREIASGIQAMMSGERAQTRRPASRRLWQERYEAGSNYSSFAESIRALAKDGGPARSRAPMGER